LGHNPITRRKEMKTLELFIRLKEEDLETLLAKHEDEFSLKFFLSREVDKAIEKECEEIENKVMLGLIENKSYIKDRNCTHCNGTGIDPTHECQCIFCVNSIVIDKYKKAL